MWKKCYRYVLQISKTGFLRKWWQSYCTWSTPWQIWLRGKEIRGQYSHCSLIDSELSYGMGKVQRFAELPPHSANNGQRILWCFTAELVKPPAAEKPCCFPTDRKMPSSVSGSVEMCVGVIVRKCPGFLSLSLSASLWVLFAALPDAMIAASKLRSLLKLAYDMTITARSHKSTNTVHT